MDITNVCHQISKASFKNSFVNKFPGDLSGEKSTRSTPKVLYSTVDPSPVKRPKLLAWSESLGKELGLSPSHDQVDVALLAGSLVVESMIPYAACYGGHQFGHWSGQLGDGRAITLGELHCEHSHFEIQLKGAGPTPYSRRADGRAVLRSSVREYLMSEAMHYLGVPTTRALSLVSSGESVTRDMFYTGDLKDEPGAIVARVAPSFLRFGSFEILAAREEYENLVELVEWTIDNFYPEIIGEGEERILNWFKEVCERTADMIIHWLRVGFVHGVMNSDNMSILGLTIDYGPFSMLDDYNPMFTPNTTDLPGRRYAFSKQASIGQWNLERLAESLAPLFDNNIKLEAILVGYQSYFSENFYSMMGKKLGLDEVKSDDDHQLISQTDQLLRKLNFDMTLFFNLLSDVESASDPVSYFEPALYRELNTEEKKILTDYIDLYLDRISKNSFSRSASIEIMKKINPTFILRNHLLFNAIEALARGDNGPFEELREEIVNPYAKKSGALVKRRPNWAKNTPGCSTLSCSS